MVARRNDEEGKRWTTPGRIRRIPASNSDDRPRSYTRSKESKPNTLTDAIVGAIFTALADLTLAAADTTYRWCFGPYELTPEDRKQAEQQSK
ncbi:hypothetical protein ACFL2Q_04500 [Thermodesulfobacteriota bacterium]